MQVYSGVFFPISGYVSIWRPSYIYIYFLYNQINLLIENLHKILWSIHSLANSCTLTLFSPSSYSYLLYLSLLLVMKFHSLALLNLLEPLVVFLHLINFFLIITSVCLFAAVRCLIWTFLNFFTNLLWRSWLDLACTAAVIAETMSLSMMISFPRLFRWIQASLSALSFCFLLFWVVFGAKHFYQNVTCFYI